MKKILVAICALAILLGVMSYIKQDQDIKISQVEWVLKNNQYHTKIHAENMTGKPLSAKITYRGRTSGTTMNASDRNDEHTYNIELDPIEKRTINRVVPFNGTVRNISASVWKIEERW